VSFNDAFCLFDRGELWLRGMYIAEYSHGTVNNHIAVHDRKLLLTKSELNKLQAALKEKGLTIVPLKIFFTDKSLVKINVKAADEVKEYFTVGRTGKHYNDTTYQTNVIVYTVFNKDFKGKLVLKAFDKENAEIGRKTLEVNKKTDDAKYIDFVFDKRTPLSLADYYTLEIKK